MTWLLKKKNLSWSSFSDVLQNKKETKWLRRSRRLRQEDGGMSDGTLRSPKSIPLLFTDVLMMVCHLDRLL
jgi:hypothetical protein